MVLDLQLPVKSVPITTNVSLNPAYGEVYSIQHYVIKFVGDLCHVYGFLWVLRSPPQIKLTAIAEILLNTITLTPPMYTLQQKQNRQRKEAIVM